MSDDLRPQDLIYRLEGELETEERLAPEKRHESWDDHEGPIHVDDLLTR